MPADFADVAEEFCLRQKRLCHRLHRLTRIRCQWCIRENLCNPWLSCILLILCFRTFGGNKICPQISQMAQKSFGFGKKGLCHRLNRLTRIRFQCCIRENLCNPWLSCILLILCFRTSGAIKFARRFR